MTSFCKVVALLSLGLYLLIITLLLFIGALLVFKHSWFLKSIGITLLILDFLFCFSSLYQKYKSAKED